MNGGGGLRWTSLRSTVATVNAPRPASMAATACLAAASSGMSYLPSFLSERWVRRAVKLAPGAGEEVGVHGPVLARHERLDLGLALADQAQRDRLHAPGRAGARQLAPQHRREREADQVVERAARQIGLDQRLVEVARVGDGVEHGGLGDLVEHHALDRDAVERALLAQQLEHVPGDRLALAVGVGGEHQGIGALELLGDGVDPAGGLGLQRPAHGEVLVRAHRAVLGRQVADMAVARPEPCNRGPGSG